MKVFYCPVNGWDCPYWSAGMTCMLVNDGRNPLVECDDAFSMYGETDLDSYLVETGD